MKVLICDDELLIRKGLCMMIQKQYAHADVTLCQNGKEALEHIQNETFTFILTDIQMPEMNGLAFIKEVHRLQPDTPIVVISGYSSFEYAVEALRYGVKEYLVKPIDRHKLFNVVDTIMAAQTVEKEETEKELITKLKVQLHSTKVDETIALYQQLQFLKYGYYILVGQTEMTRNLHHECNFIMINEQQETIIITDNVEHWESEKTIGMSSRKYGYVEIKKAYDEASEAAQWRFFKNESTLSYDHISTKEEFVPMMQLEKIVRFLGTDRDEELMATLRELCNESHLQSCSIGYTRHIHKKLLVMVQEKVIGSYKLPESNRDMKEQLEEYETYSQWLEAWEATLRYYSTEIYKKTGVQSYLAQSLQYIEQNYAQDITLAMVSNYVSLNYSYFSTVFKEHMGQSFGEYVRHLRITKAKEYLKNDTLKIYEIAHAVGYQDPKQFTKTFRKLTGVSPQEYREKYLARELIEV